MPETRTIAEAVEEQRGALTELEERELPRDFTFYDEAGKPFASRMWLDIPAQLQAGQIRLHADEVISMQLADGSVERVPGSMVREVIEAGGWVLDERGQRRGQYEEVQEEAFGGQPLLSTAFGLASTATLGAFDVGARLLGYEEQVREVQERKPLYSAGGQILGLVGPALLTAGTSTAVSGAGVAAKAAGVGAKIARAVPGVRLARGVEAVAARAAGKGALAKAGIRAGAYGLEGLGIAVAAGTRETMLSEDPVTAEAWISNIGSHAQYAIPLGAGIGGGLSLLGSGASKLLAKGGKVLDDFKAGKDVTVKSSEVAQEIKAYGTAREPGYMALHGEESAKFTGAGKTLQRATDDPQFLKSTTGLQRQLRIEGKALEDTIVNPEAVAAAHAADDAATLAKLKAARKVEAPVKPPKDLPPKIDKEYKAANRARYEAEEGSIEAANKRFNREAVAHRRALKKARKPTDRMTWKQYNKENMARLMKSEGGHKGAMKKMGADWQAFKKTPEYRKLAPKAAAKKVKPLKLKRGEADNRAWRNLFNKKGKKTVELGPKQIDDFIDAIESGALAAKRAEHAALLPAILEQNQALLATIEAVSAKGGTLAAQTAGLAKGYAATAALGILPGGFIGAGAALLAPRILARLKTAVMEPLAAAGGKAATRMSGAVESVASAGKLAARASRPGATKILESVAYAPKAVMKGAERAVAPTKSPLLAAFREREKELYAATLPGPDGTPQMTTELRELLAKQLEPIKAVDPVLADQMETVVARKVEYLATILPRRPGAMALQVGPDTWRPPDMDLRSFARSAAAVEDPISVIERAAEGSVTPEDSEALRSVYPELFAQSRNEILGKLSELQETLPYAKRIALSIFLGVPVDPSMSPEVLRVLQGHFEEEPGTAGGAQPPQPQPQFGSVERPQNTPAQERQVTGS